MEGTLAPPGAFVELVHRYGRSKLFLVGIILFSVGNIISQVLSLSIFSFYSIIMTALPIIGFWMIYTASKTPRLPEKTLTAMTIFKVILIIALVFICLGILAVVLIGLLAGVAANFADWDSFSGLYPMDGVASSIIAAVFIVILVMVIISVIVMIIYYRAVLRVVSGIRSGILSNVMNPLRGVGVFSVFTYIGAVCSVFGAFTLAASSRLINNTLSDMFYSIPSDYYSFIKPLMGIFSNYLWISYLFIVLAQVGTVLCVITLGKFNNSLKYGR